MTRGRALLAAMIVLAGCGPTATPDDAGVDATQPDADRVDAFVADGGRDAGIDGGSDAGADAGMDAGSDVGIDAYVDDAGTDAFADDVGIDAFLAPCVGPPGLYAGDDCTVLATGVRPYHPRYALWSDGNDKERFVFLPRGTQIDTSDPDRWGFPIGTRLYKTFSIGGLRIETRVLEKIADARGVPSWTMRSYLWSADQRSVSLVGPFGARDVLGTDHDIPTYAECVRCHSVAQDDTVNGFSAVQLAHDEGGVTLADLNAEGRLTTPIDPATAQIPGDATTSAALGYLHANCGNCHGGPTPEHGLDYWHRVGTTELTSSRTWTTAVCTCSVWTHVTGTGDLANLRIAPAHPELSVSTLRMASRVATDQMPPIGTAVVDTEGLALIESWISSLDPTSNGCPHGCPFP